MIRAHTAIPVTNLNRAIAFYKVLEFVAGEKWERKDMGMSGQLLEHPSGFQIELISHPGNHAIKHPKTPEVFHLAIPVDDLEDAIQALVSVGGSIIRPITKGITVKRLAFLEDPDGFAIELFEPQP